MKTYWDKSYYIYAHMSAEFDKCVFIFGGKDYLVFDLSERNEKCELTQEHNPEPDCTLVQMADSPDKILIAVDLRKPDQNKTFKSLKTTLSYVMYIMNLIDIGFSDINSDNDLIFHLPRSLEKYKAEADDKFATY